MPVGRREKRNRPMRVIAASRESKVLLKEVAPSSPIIERRSREFRRNERRSRGGMQRMCPRLQSPLPRPGFVRNACSLSAAAHSESAAAAQLELGVVPGAKIWSKKVEREARLSRRAPSTSPIRRAQQPRTLPACPPWQLHLARGHDCDDPGWCPVPWFDSRAGLCGLFSCWGRIDARGHAFVVFPISNVFMRRCAVFVPLSQVLLGCEATSTTGTTAARV